jgi:hypothetical protein
MYRCRFTLSLGLLSAFTVFVTTAPTNRDPEGLAGWGKIIGSIIGGVATLFGLFSMFRDSENRKKSHQMAQ